MKPDFRPDAIDTCVLIHYFLDDDQGIPGAVAAATALIEGEEPIVVPAMAAVEVVTGVPLRKGQQRPPIDTEEIRAARDFLDSPYIIIAELDGAAARLAGELGTQAVLKPADAAVLAAAIQADCEHLYTYDQQLINATAGLHQIKVTTPPEPDYGPLFDLPEGHTP